MNTAFTIIGFLIFFALVYRAIIFLFTHAVGFFVLVGAAMIALVVLADADMLPRLEPIQSTISQN